MAQLSSESDYERLFGVRHRGSGRPGGERDEVFPRAESRAVDPLIATVAKRRAYAVVHEENKERLRDVFMRELAVLKRRGVKRVAADVGVNLSEQD